MVNNENEEACGGDDNIEILKTWVENDFHKQGLVNKAHKYFLSKKHSVREDVSNADLKDYYKGDIPTKIPTHPFFCDEINVSNLNAKPFIHASGHFFTSPKILKRGRLSPVSIYFALIGNKSEPSCLIINYDDIRKTDIHSLKKIKEDTSNFLVDDSTPLSLIVNLDGSDSSDDSDSFDDSDSSNDYGYDIEENNYPLSMFADDLQQMSKWSPELFRSFRNIKGSTVSAMSQDQYERELAEKERTYPLVQSTIEQRRAIFPDERGIKRQRRSDRKEKLQDKRRSEKENRLKEILSEARSTVHRIVKGSSIQVEKINEMNYTGSIPLVIQDECTKEPILK